jgi:cell division septum initiation protein DivIVA
MAKKSSNGQTELEQLKKENEELRKRLDELESLLNEGEAEEEIQEIENPYTVTNRAITELVTPKDTMFYLSGNQISLILTAFEFARLPSYFGEEPVVELAQFADKLKHYLVSKGGRGRRDVLRVLRVSSGQARENVNKSIFKQLLGHGKQDIEEDEE